MSGSPNINPRALLALLLAVITVSAASPALAAAGSSERVSASAGSIRHYWTPARMGAAEPLDAEAAAAQVERSKAGSRELRAASATYVPSADADGPARARLVTGTPPGPNRVLGVGVVRDEITDPAAADVRAHGKVFFTIPQGSEAGDYICSGTAVNSRNRSVVWTAGHCVFDLSSGGGYATNWVFVPGYKDKAAPFGEWPATRLATTTGWRTSANIRYDLGAAVVAPNASGQRLGDVVGGRGIGFDQPRDQLYSAFGYPAVAPPLEFTGESEFRCMSNQAGIDEPVGSGPPPTAINCDMTGGSSGGGWIVGTTLLSVTSYGYAIDPDRLYGPYMSASAKELYKSVGGRRKKKRHHGTKGANGGKGRAAGG